MKNGALCRRQICPARKKKGKKPPVWVIESFKCAGEGRLHDRKCRFEHAHAVAGNVSSRCPLYLLSGLSPLETTDPRAAWSRDDY